MEEADKDLKRVNGGASERIQSSEIRKRNGYKTPIDQNGGKQERKDQLSEPAVLVLECEVKECNGDCPQNPTRALRHENEAARDCA
jgi:hypothetical protein